MSDLVDRLVELASWCEQHSYECPVTARDDLMAAAFQLVQAWEERDEAREAAREIFHAFCSMDEDVDELVARWPWLRKEEQEG